MSKKQTKSESELKTSQTKRREDPAEFMQAYVQFKADNPEHATLTAKGFAIVRHEREQKEQEVKK